MNQPSSELPTGDTGVNPTWAGSTNGVPSTGAWNWTASSRSYMTTDYFFWNGTMGASSNFGNSFNLRCVLPSSAP